MRSLRRHRAILKRRNTYGNYDEDGKWINTVELTETTIPCCIQPDADGSLKRYLTDGVIEKDCKILITEYPLKGSSEADTTENDILNINGKDYEVIRLEPWLGLSRINATLVLAVRKDKL